MVSAEYIEMSIFAAEELYTCAKVVLLISAKVQKIAHWLTCSTR